MRSDLQSPTNSSSINIEIEFSEDVIGFDSLDVVLTNALLNSFQGDKKNYQLIINPVDFGDVTVKVPSNTAKDSVGGFNTESNLFSIKYSSIPSVVISSSVALTNLSPIPVRVVFSKDVNDFEASDIKISNGSFSIFCSGSISVDLIPSSEGEVTVDIDANIASDSDGNGNIALNNFPLPMTKQLQNYSINLIPSPMQLTVIPISLVFLKAYLV